ncbi:ExbD/TolR family protein [Alkalimarinus alittae]|uniref:Biopolymer transporter ExbD n=1 Tax=Alkalimarinus alittae TaxID=2961619 RepID=A0ABY6MXL2_9ALTE|nr:biopolymer transporter ExbD [Alkalimarinus alittae]UZE94566.1 biopolymer transporter ExbD [Alkalimarinus alittae]
MNFVQVPISSKNQNDENLIPLINVVFLMLIFFMVAGVIRETDNSSINYPKSLSVNEIADKTITVIVNKASEVKLNKQAVSLKQLSDQLNKRVLEELDPQDLYIILKVDGAVAAESLQGVLKAIRQVGLLKVQLITEFGEIT